MFSLFNDFLVCVRKLDGGTMVITGAQLTEIDHLLNDIAKFGSAEFRAHTGNVRGTLKGDLAVFGVEVLRSRVKAAPGLKRDSSSTMWAVVKRSVYGQ